MTVNLSGSLMGLSLLTGDSSVFSTATTPIAFDSKAVRTAKAQFTLAETTPPWKQATATGSASAQIASILASRTIIDKTSGSTDILPDDIKTSFTAYKALEKLRVLAEAASATTASNALRTQYEKAFAKGLSDLQTYLTTAPSDKVNLAFGKPSSTAQSSKLAATEAYEADGKGLVSKRSDAIPNLTGQEQFSVKLSRGTLAETFTVDLSQGTQPPTLDSVVSQLNSAISSTLIYKADGTPQLDAEGDPVTRWSARFEPVYSGGKWGLKLETPDGLEQVSLDQVGAKDSLVVATGQTALDAPTATQVFRLNDPNGANARVTMGTISALDRDATEQNTLAGKTTTVTTTSTDMDGKIKTSTTKTSNVYAATDAAAVATDAQGYSYVVGTTAGDLGANRSDGDNNLFLTKMDGAGNVVWQRSLGASGSSTGAAVSVGADGSIVVAGTVTGGFNGVTSGDGDMVVAKYAANGDEKFSTVVRSGGIDAAKAVAVGADGSVYVGGRTATGKGDAFVARIDATGKIAERRTIDSGGTDQINALAIDADGNLLAVVSQDGDASVRKLKASALATDLGSIALGTADVRAIAVAGDGTIAVGGATSAALSGTQVNTKNTGRDGFVARIDSALSGASVTYLGSAADDQVDSIAFLGGDLYAGGRTTGDLAATRRGPTDGFVARIDAVTGVIGNTSQFGQALLRTEPVRIAADKGGANAISALGYGRGAINPAVSEKLTTQTTVRAGDYFSIKADGGAVRKVAIEAGDTLKSIATRIQGMIGASKGTVTATAIDGVQQLRVTMKPGHELELIPGGTDTDALAKLGIEPQRIATQATLSSSAPKVRPGGNFGLDLTEALSLSSLDNAKVAMKKVEEAISMTQTAYRSLYWDDGKARMVDGVKNAATGTQSTARETAQLANYQAALTRLNSGASATLGF
jgi:trimeric autotransporter adhesin